MRVVILCMFLVLAGCSTSARLKTGDMTTGCDLVCKDCKEIKMKCNTELDTDTKTEGKSTGTVATPGGTVGG